AQGTDGDRGAPRRSPARPRAALSSVRRRVRGYRYCSTRITYIRRRASGRARCRGRGWLMATKHAATEYLERDLASAQLDELALAHDGSSWTEWKDAVLDWHLRRFVSARSEAWIPGFADSHDDDPVIRKFLSRFYRHHMHAAIVRLRAENVEL